MTYHFLEGAKKPTKGKKLLLILPLIGIITGAYVLVTTLAPAWEPLVTPNDKVAQKLLQEPEPSTQNRLYIPKINVDVAIVQGNDASVLDQGAWWRQPQNGNPKGGGNFVLSAHRSSMGFTPSQTRAKSPFYQIDKLTVGDEIFVDYNGQRYPYRIINNYKVDRTAVEIEQRTEKPTLTLYSCDLRGELAGREVIEASPVTNAAITYKH